MCHVLKLQRWGSNSYHLSKQNSRHGIQSSVWAPESLISNPLKEAISAPSEDLLSSECCPLELRGGVTLSSTREFIRVVAMVPETPKCWGNKYPLLTLSPDGVTGSLRGPFSSSLETLSSCVVMEAVGVGSVATWIIKTQRQILGFILKIRKAKQPSY